MVFGEVATLSVAVPVCVVVLLAVAVFIYGFKAPSNPPTYRPIESDDEDSSSKRKRKAKNSRKPAPSGLTAAKAAVTKAVVKPDVTSTKEKVQEVKPKKAKKVKKLDEVTSAAVPAVVEAPEPEEDAGEWVVAKSRKRQQQKPGEKKAEPATKQSSVDQIPATEPEAAVEQPGPATSPASKKKKEKKAKKTPVTEEVVREEATEQLQVATSTKADEGDGSSPAHSITTGSSLSESWVSPDEMQKALKDFESAMAASSSQAPTASPDPSPAPSKKKKKKSKNTGKKVSSDSASGPVAEEPPLTKVATSQLGDKGNPYRDVEIDAAALADVAKELSAAPVERIEAPVERIEAVSALVLGDRGNPYAGASKASGKKKKSRDAEPSCSAAGESASASDSVPSSSDAVGQPATAAFSTEEAAPAFDELSAEKSVEWVEAKTQKKKKRVRRDN